MKCTLPHTYTYTAYLYCIPILHTHAVFSENRCKRLLNQKDRTNLLCLILQRDPVQVIPSKECI